MRNRRKNLFVPHDAYQENFFPGQSSLKSLAKKQVSQTEDLAEVLEERSNLSGQRSLLEALKSRQELSQEDGHQIYAILV